MRKEKQSGNAATGQAIEDIFSLYDRLIVMRDQAELLLIRLTNEITRLQPKTDSYIAEFGKPPDIKFSHCQRCDNDIPAGQGYHECWDKSDPKYYKRWLAAKTKMENEKL